MTNTVVTDPLRREAVEPDAKRPQLQSQELANLLNQLKQTEKARREQLRQQQQRELAKFD